MVFIGFQFDTKSDKRKLFSFSNNRIYCINFKYKDDLILIGTWGGGLVTLDKNSYEINEYKSSDTSVP